jgi:hypothetical protein
MPDCLGGVPGGRPHDLGQRHPQVEELAHDGQQSELRGTVATHARHEVLGIGIDEIGPWMLIW